jgi:hypothetical protein
MVCSLRSDRKNNSPKWHPAQLSLRWDPSGLGYPHPCGVGVQPRQKRIGTREPPEPLPVEETGASKMGPTWNLCRIDLGDRVFSFSLFVRSPGLSGRSEDDAD